MARWQALASIFIVGGVTTRTLPFVLTFIRSTCDVDDGGVLKTSK